MVHRPGYPHYLDETGYSESPIPELYACGWCATPLYEPLDELWAEVEGAFYPCLTGAPRPDLAVHFDRPAMRTSGFAARFPVQNPAATVHFHAAANRSQPPVMIWEPSFAAAVDAPRVPSSPPLHAPPLISILLPVASASPYYLWRAIQSVVNQTYPHWELFLAYNNSAAPFPPHIANFAKSDTRIRLIDCAAAGAHALPTLALREASGEYTAVLHRQGELHPSALLEAARAIARHPPAVMVYTDEDCIDNCGRTIRRTSKPGYHFELLLRHDCIGQLACIRTSAIRQAGGFRPEFGPAQYWDLLLRVCESAAPATIRHVPEPLYGRRHSPAPTRQSQAVNVLENYITRRGLYATAHEGFSPHTLRLKPRLDESARVAVFIRMGDGPQQANALLRSRFPPHARLFEIGIAGVYPTDGPPAPLLTLDETGADIGVFINCPIDHVNHEFFEELVAQAQRPQCGIAGGVTSGSIDFPELVRPGPHLLNYFFASRIPLLAEAGALASLGHDSMRDVCNKMIELTARKGLEVLYTPYAVATVRSSSG
jgi:Glycosyl transferase family 2